MQLTSSHQLLFTRRKILHTAGFLQSRNANQFSITHFFKAKYFLFTHFFKANKTSVEFMPKFWKRLFYCENRSTCEDNQNYVVDIGSLGWSISSSKWSIGGAGGQLTQVSILAMSYVLSDTSVLLMMILRIIFSTCEQLMWLTFNTRVNTGSIICLIWHQRIDLYHAIVNDYIIINKSIIMRMTRRVWKCFF